jgi:DNA repair protein RadC
LLEKGRDSVSDAGLVAILLRSGIKGKDAVSLGRDIINHFGGLRGLFGASKADLEKIKGLGSSLFIIILPGKKSQVNLI